MNNKTTIIADSGSSKTAWRILEQDGQIRQERTLGLNPYYISEAEMLAELKKTFLSEFSDRAIDLHFYGSGCASSESKQQMHRIFSEILPASNCTILDDIIGAARASCGQNEGISCILGTGSNTCLYNGEIIVDQIPSSGYILGDEGSGSYMGKQLLGDFIRGDMPKELSEKLIKRYDLNREDILESVYRQPRPNRYMAQFTKFIFQHRNTPYCSNLIMNSFKLFFERYVMKYEGYRDKNLHFVGSIGFYFSDFLRKTAKLYEIRIMNILEDPIAGLSLYHQDLLKNQ